ncbi:MAG: hypothetical protein LQ351_003308 [Letrouitia transgressa]|nr:MAG: hypothetical protein LQ351_003308 [Letrouitia transgressa]
MAAVAEPQQRIEIDEKAIANGSVETTEVNRPATDLSALPATTVDGSINPAKTPFTSPTPESKSRPAPVLTAEQSSKYDKLLSIVTLWTDKPSVSTPNSPRIPLTDSDRIWLTRECLLRYLRATKWSVNEASTRLLSTLTWRHEYGLEKHTADYISPENATGKQVIFGYDVAGRPCLYLNPAKQNTERSLKQVEHLVFMLERVIDLMPPGQEMLAMLINFDKKMGADRPPLWQGKLVLTILQSHYPERLGRALLMNVHWVVWTFLKLINPFIDPNTKEKIKYDQDLRQLVPPSQLMTSHDGDIHFEYEHSVYWPALNELAAKKRLEMVERWERRGKKVGESELFLRGGIE